MKTGAIIGGIIGLSVGLGSLVVMNLPPFLSYLFLGNVYAMILPSGDLGEGLGYLYFVFSTVVGVGYGLIVASVIKRLQK